MSVIYPYPVISISPAPVFVISGDYTHYGPNNEQWKKFFTIFENISLFNKRKFDYIIFEVKDLDVLDYFNNKNPDYMIITNLFKDQIIRKYDFKNYINNFKKKIEEFKKKTFIKKWFIKKD